MFFTRVEQTLENQHVCGMKRENGIKELFEWP